MTATVDNAVADLQRANAELQRQLAESGAERDEALAERAALAKVLDTINRSPGDLAPVFDAMLEKALSLCDAAFGLLLVYDGEAFRAVATQGALPVVIDFLREPIRMTHRGAFDPLLRGETFVQVAAASLGAWCSKPGSCISTTWQPTPNTCCPTHPPRRTALVARRAAAARG